MHRWSQTRLDIVLRLILSRSHKVLGEHVAGQRRIWPHEDYQCHAVHEAGLNVVPVKGHGDFHPAAGLQRGLHRSIHLSQGAET